MSSLAPYREARLAADLDGLMNHARAVEDGPITRINRQRFRFDFRGGRQARAGRDAILVQQGESRSVSEIEYPPDLGMVLQIGHLIVKVVLT